MRIPYNKLISKINSSEVLKNELKLRGDILKDLFDNGFLIKERNENKKA